MHLVIPITMNENATNMARDSRSNYIVVKEIYTQNSEANTLLQQSIMSQCSSSFYLFVFKEITFQVMFTVAALFFIFGGLPWQLCLCVPPVILVVLYLVTLSTHFMKAMEATQIKPQQIWVAVAYESSLGLNSRKISHEVLLECEMPSEQNVKLETMNKKIIGVINVKEYKGPSHGIWMYGLAVHPDYKRKGVARCLIRAVKTYSLDKYYQSIESVVNELQTDAHTLLEKEGFKLRGMYDSKLLGTYITLGKSHLGFDNN